MFEVTGSLITYLLQMSGFEDVATAFLIYLQIDSTLGCAARNITMDILGNHLHPKY